METKCPNCQQKSMVNGICSACGYGYEPLIYPNKVEDLKDIVDPTYPKKTKEPSILEYYKLISTIETYKQCMYHILNDICTELNCNVNDVVKISNKVLSGIAIDLRIVKTKGYDNPIDIKEIS